MTSFTYKFILVFLFNLSLITEPCHSCTIFYVQQDNVILGGSNEDWRDPCTMFWIYPAEQEKHGWIKFGFCGGFPQSGMNDQGLFWDATSGPYLAMPYSEDHKILLPGPVMQQVIETCSTVNEARQIFNQYYCQDQYKAQYLVGDSCGKSMIVEGDDIILKEKSFQVLTNFYHSHPELGGYPCWRYDIATTLLEACDTLTTYYAGEVLASTHQEGSYPTRFSLIYDLRNLSIYLFYNHHYEEFLTIDLTEEFQKGKRVYDIPSLFSKTELTYPTNEELITSSSILFKWRGLPASKYQVVYSESFDFQEYASIPLPDSLDYPESGFPKTLMVVHLVSILTVIIFRKRGSYFVVIAVLIFSTTANSCKKELTQHDLDDTIEFFLMIDSLKQNRTYYWKVRASTGSTDHFHTESLVRSFKTLI